MQTSHFHYESGWWPRGKGVRLRQDFTFPGEYIYSELDVEHGYWLLGSKKVLFDAFARERRAHLEFLRAASSDNLLEFVERWGPLSLSSEEWRRGQSWMPVVRHWGMQRRLRSLVNLFSSVRSGKNETRHLGEFIRLRDQMVYFWFETARLRGHYEPSFIAWFKEFSDAVLRLPQYNEKLGVERGKEGEIVALLDAAPRSNLRKLADLAVEQAAELKTTLRVHRQRPRTTIRPRLAAEDLYRALEFMIVLDEWADHPLQICEECTSPFRGETRHERRYCSPECSRRVSSREFKRRQRFEQQRKERNRS
jgi:hypothetical protein